MLGHQGSCWLSRSLQNHELILLHMTEMTNHLQNREPLPNPSAPAPCPQNSSKECNQSENGKHSRIQHHRQVSKRHTWDSWDWPERCRDSAAAPWMSRLVSAASEDRWCEGFKNMIRVIAKDLCMALLCEILFQRFLWSGSSNGGFAQRSRLRGRGSSTSANYICHLDMQVHGNCQHVKRYVASPKWHLISNLRS